MVDINKHNVDLLYEIKEGHKEAFKKLYDFYKEDVFRFILKMTKSNVFAEDILQQVFIKIWENKEDINPDLNFSAYIKKITFHFTLNFLKRASCDERLRHQIMKGMNSCASDALERLENRDILNLYHEAVNCLPKQKKLIYDLSKREELTYEEIATHTQLSKNTVRNHMAEAIRMIKTFVAGKKNIYSN